MNRPHPHDSLACGRVGVCVLAGALQLACADGYPAKESGLMLRQDMSSAESVAAMNQIGKGQKVEHRWRYALQPGCVLVIETVRSLKKNETITLPLDETTSAMTKGENGVNYRVSLRAQRSEASNEMVILEHTSWSDATQMRWLLDHVRAHCARAALSS